MDFFLPEFQNKLLQLEGFSEFRNSFFVLFLLFQNKNQNFGIPIGIPVQLQLQLQPKWAITASTLTGFVIPTAT
jgi:hypothetical protein